MPRSRRDDDNVLHRRPLSPQALNSAGTQEPRFMATSGARSLDETQRDNLALALT
jgi:hypothetical protein